MHLYISTLQLELLASSWVGFIILEETIRFVKLPYLKY